MKVTSNERSELMVKKEYWIDICKIMSAILVIFLHTINIGIETNEINIASLAYFIGVFAVPLFFMINGYLQLDKIKGYKYAFKKIFNILFVCFMWNIPVFIAEVFIKKEQANIFYNMLKNFLQDGFFFHFWFLGALIIIYLFLPLFQKLFNTKKAYKYITIILMAMLVCIDFFNILSNQFGYGIIRNNLCHTFRIWTWLFYFFIGGFIKKVDPVRNIDTPQLTSITIIMCIITVLYEYFFGYLLYSDMHVDNFYDSLIIIITTFLIFNLIRRFNIKNNFMSKLCSLTMGIYIVHPIFIRIFRSLGLMKYDGLNIIIAFIVFIISATFSWLIMKIPYLNKIIKI
ncbi:MAG TPA: acyltransferase family protein [Clostridiaceae bacterium]|jgi:surface polysaccharide O-acyltransferase-like enzyme|nr:acyltransferase family protein [Clostridiaceae bacterium]